ncbi:Coiled-coil domain-containing protein 115 [Eumeta japonica]|uniref:Vacuolar ATPase assembly protein VMA22 n=1 Tax=Eumeta variegata TaxID=151549 RepID=A0A4C1VK19_EUMVA|nr:Coiled-coil domain-containing protein 115 [Eumeta japonica]
MTEEKLDKNDPQYGAVCELLDKLTLKQLVLMEEKMRCELNIESSINSGSIHLAKSRYIMGHKSVSATQLPTENSPDFSASIICETEDEDGVQQLKVSDNDAEDKVNPIKWFGVLVPQNLHRAQAIFHNAINYIVECVNVQKQLDDVIYNIHLLKRYKSIQLTSQKKDQT